MYKMRINPARLPFLLCCAHPQLSRGGAHDDAWNFTKHRRLSRNEHVFSTMSLMGYIWLDIRHKTIIYFAEDMVSQTYINDKHLLVGQAIQILSLHL